MTKSENFSPISQKLNIILADDDRADRLLFEDALSELPVNVQLTTVQDGEELIQWLTENEDQLPDALFLDLRMPRKNGFASLSEIKRNFKLQDLPVFILTTLYEVERIKQVFKDAAHYYIKKPSDFEDLKKLIYKSLKLVSDENFTLPPDKENFILNVD